MLALFYLIFGIQLPEHLEGLCLTLVMEEMEPPAITTRPGICVLLCPEDVLSS